MGIKMTDLEKYETIKCIWQADPLQSQSTLEDYCRAVAERLMQTYGDRLTDAKPATIFDALQKKGLLCK